MSYFHLVLIHMSAWFCLIIAADVYKKGAPPLTKTYGQSIDFSIRIGDCSGVDFRPRPWALHELSSKGG